MTFLKPYDSVHKVISMPRWERDELNKYFTINFSGTVQEKVILPMIQEKNPDIFEKYYPRHVSFNKKTEIEHLR
jgi:hypothetical protein